MSGIFPVAGVAAGLALNADPSAQVVEGCLPLWYPPRCNPRFEPAQANAVISELINAINCLGIPYDCNEVDNLCRALTTLKLTCRSEMTTPPANGVPALWVDDTLAVPHLMYWDCNTEQYFGIAPTIAATTSVAPGSIV